MNRRDHPWSLEETLAELEYLANTAGAQAVGVVTQRANRLGPTYVVGQGARGLHLSRDGSAPFGRIGRCSNARFQLW